LTPSLVTPPSRRPHKGSPVTAGFPRPAGDTFQVFPDLPRCPTFRPPSVSKPNDTVRVSPIQGHSLLPTVVADPIVTECFRSALRSRNPNPLCTSVPPALKPSLFPHGCRLISDQSHLLRSTQCTRPHPHNQPQHYPSPLATHPPRDIFLTYRTSKFGCHHCFRLIPLPQSASSTA
jgi:hypothetical protein